jgi:hypothetical protein
MPGIHYATVGAVVLAFIVAAVVARAGHAVINRLLEALDFVGAENREAVRARPAADPRAHDAGIRRCGAGGASRSRSNASA